MPAADGGDAEARARYRRFVREHHPDVGGDPEVFAAGIARLRSEQLRAARGQAGYSDARYDAPIVVLSDWQPSVHSEEDTGSMNATNMGLLAGLILGVAAAFGGVSGLFIALLLGAVGLLIGRALDGELDRDLDVFRSRGRNR